MSTCLKWRGVTVVVRPAPDWLRLGVDHIEVETEPRPPLPITETGFRSHFLAPAELEAFGGPATFVRAGLDANVPDWVAQLPLFPEGGP